MSEIILNNISDCFIGNNHVKEIWYSNTKIWPTTTHDYSLDYLTFESLDNNNAFNLHTNTGDPNVFIIYYSIDDGQTWDQLSNNGEGTPTLDAGEKIIWKYTSDRTCGIQFESSGRFIVSGNIMSMLYGDNFVGQTTISTNDTFNWLFSNCSGLVNASNLILPATTLAQSCYYFMFSGCTSLTTTPELPATTLANYCYTGMFDGCTSLTTAPELPATTLAQGCYQYMFQFCTSLATAPELLATTLATVCYQCMFQGCTNLNYIKCLATDISALACVDEWVNSVAQTGTFIKDVNMNDWTRGRDGIPTGWTVQEEGVIDYSLKYLTFEAIESGTFAFTRNGRTVDYSLDNGVTWTTLAANTQSPTVSAGSKILWKQSTQTPVLYTGLGRFTSTAKFNVMGNIMSMCYGDNFVGQTTIPNMFQFTALFEDCTKLISAENLVLPATTLTKACYSYLFNRCTSVEKVPELPAQILAEQCYEYTFHNCSKINYIKCLATDISANLCTTHWLEYVSSTGTFVKDSNMNNWTRGRDGIPTGWTVENA